MSIRTGQQTNSYRIAALGGDGASREALRVQLRDRRFPVAELLFLDSGPETIPSLAGRSPDLIFKSWDASLDDSAIYDLVTTQPVIIHLAECERDSETRLVAQDSNSDLLDSPARTFATPRWEAAFLASLVLPLHGLQPKRVIVQATPIHVESNMAVEPFEAARDEGVGAPIGDQVSRLVGLNLGVSWTTQPFIGEWLIGTYANVTVDLSTEAQVARVRSLLQSASGLMVLETPEREPTTLALMAAHNEATVVGTVRSDASSQAGVQILASTTAPRKAAAKQAVQLAEALAARNRLGSG